MPNSGPQIYLSAHRPRCSQKRRTTNHNTMATSMMRQFLAPSIYRATATVFRPTFRPIVCRATKQSPAIPQAPLRSFSASTNNMATYNQVRKVGIPLPSLHPSLPSVPLLIPAATATNVRFSLSAGLPRRPTSAQSCLPGPAPGRRPLAQGRVSEGGHHEAEEAQFGRTQDGQG
jgi:hypothetical protein